MIAPEIGAVVEVLVSEPWEFHIVLGSSRFQTRVLDVDACTHDVLLQALVPFVFDSAKWEYFVATRRHVEPPSAIRDWDGLPYNLVRVPSEIALGPRALDPSIRGSGNMFLIASVSAIGST